MCLAKGHNAVTPVRLKPATHWSRVKIALYHWATVLSKNSMKIKTWISLLLCTDMNICCHVSYINMSYTWPRSAVGNVSGNRCESDCRSRGHKFDSGPVPYFRGDWSWNNFYGRSPCWIIQEGLLSVTSESMCTKYWLTACSSLPRKKVWLGELAVTPWP